MFHARILRYLDEVVRAGSIRKAAGRLGIAASSISRQIAEIEDELGAPLFERLPGKLRLTAAGELLVTHIRTTLKDYDRVAARIADLREGGRGTIRIATVNGLAGSLVPRVALDFARAHRGVRFQVKGLLRADIVTAVKEGEVEIGVGYNLPADPGLHVLEMFEMRLGAVVAPGHPLARKKEVRLSECIEFPVVFSDETLSIHPMVMAALGKANAQMRVVVATNSIDLMKYGVMDGERVTFLSAPDVAEEQRAGTLVWVPISDRTLPVHTISMVQRANTALDRAPGLFVEALRQALEALTDR